MNLHGWVIYNGHLPGNKFFDFATWFQEAAHKQDITMDIVKNNDVHSYLAEDTLGIIKNDLTGSLPDFVVFTDKDIYLARQLELLGVRVFNSAKAIADCDDKILTYQILAQNKLAIPKTIVAPKVFPVSNDVDTHLVQSIINKLGLPMIIKEAYGSFGEQVYLVNTIEEVISKMQELHGRPYIFQEFIATSFGRDLRLHVVGNKVAAAMYRETPDDFRSTAGGVRKGYQPTKIEKTLAVAATKAMGADFAGVDLLFGSDNKPIICEVNSNAHIRKLYNASDINIAEVVIAYIAKKMRE